MTVETVLGIDGVQVVAIPEFGVVPKSGTLVYVRGALQPVGEVTHARVLKATGRVMLGIAGPGLQAIASGVGLSTHPMGSSEST